MTQTHRGLFVAREKDVILVPREKCTKNDSEMWKSVFTLLVMSAETNGRGHLLRRLIDFEFERPNV